MGNSFLDQQRGLTRTATSAKFIIKRSTCINEMSNLIINILHKILFYSIRFHIEKIKEHPVISSKIPVLNRFQPY